MSWPCPHPWQRFQLHTGTCLDCESAVLCEAPGCKAHATGYRHTDTGPRTQYTVMLCDVHARQTHDVAPGTTIDVTDVSPARNRKAGQPGPLLGMSPPTPPPGVWKGKP
jgi:hypothetical protein